MKKFLISVFLIIVIAVSFSFIFLRLSAQSDSDNYFNKNLRYKFARYSFFRTVLGLHFDGDARFDYLSQKYKNITIKIITMNGTDVSKKTLEILADKIQQTTGKPVKTIHVRDVQLETASSLSALRKTLASGEYAAADDGAVLYIVVANSCADAASRMGSTLDENGVVFFKKTIADSMQNDSLEKFEKFSAALLLHEFGHQIGLGHNNDYGCLMNKEVEFNGEGLLLDMNSDFCNAEKKEIAKIIY
jgi:hypothetical protein